MPNTDAGPDAAADVPFLPLDVLGLVMECLVSQRRRRTLLELLLSDKATFAFGHGVLVRELAFRGGADDDRWATFAFRPDGASGFEHVRTISARGESAAALAVMQRVAKNVRRVTLEIESVTYGSNFLKAISQCAALRTLEVTFVRVDLDAALAPLPSLPRSISHVFIRFILIPDGRRVLELLARSPALETWDLGGLYDLNLRLPTFPTLVPKLRRVQLLRNAHLAELATLPLRLRELVVGLDVDRGRLWATRNLLEGLRELRFEYGATSDLLSAALPESLEKLTIDGALLSLEPGEFTAVREKLDRPGLRVVLVRKIHYGASSWNREEEVAFWRSMPNVVIEM